MKSSGLSAANLKQNRLIQKPGRFALDEIPQRPSDCVFEGDNSTVVGDGEARPFLIGISDFVLIVDSVNDRRIVTRFNFRILQNRITALWCWKYRTQASRFKRKDETTGKADCRLIAEKGRLAVACESLKARRVDF